MSAVTVRVPGKVNLALAVGAPGSDGYHPLATVFHAVSIYDEVVASTPPEGVYGISLQVSPAPRGGVPGVESIPLDSRNLAWRAAQSLAEAVGVSPDVQLDIRKGIPVAGGM